jgi:hypothetical protein
MLAGKGLYRCYASVIHTSCEFENKGQESWHYIEGRR